MKHLGLILIAVLFIGTMVNAQNDSRDQNKQRAVEANERLAKELNLTKEQVDKKAAIDAEMYKQYELVQAKRKTVMEKRQNMNEEDATPEKMDAISAEMDALRKKQMEIKKKANDLFLDILTDEQKAAYEKMRTPTSEKKPAMSK